MCLHNGTDTCTLVQSILLFQFLFLVKLFQHCIVYFCQFGYSTETTLAVDLEEEEHSESERQDSSSEIGSEQSDMHGSTSSAPCHSRSPTLVLNQPHVPSAKRRRQSSHNIEGEILSYLREGRATQHAEDDEDAVFFHSMASAC